MPTSSLLRICLGLLEPQLEASWGPGHPPVPPERPGQPLPWRWVRPVARGGHPRGATHDALYLREREHNLDLTGTGSPIQGRTTGYNTARKKTRARLPSGTPPSSLWSLGKSQQSNLLFFGPSLLLSTPTLLNRFISITKEK